MKLKLTTFLFAMLFAVAGFSQSLFPCELSGGEGEPATGGLSDAQEGQYHDNSNYFNILEINQPVTLLSAKVFANGPGPRSLSIMTAEGDVIMADIFDLPDGESVVEFNWDLVPGTYGLGSISDNPQLWRDDLNSDINYPYELGPYGAITGTSIQGDNEFNYYYFFYDVTLAPQGPSVNSGGYPCWNVELLDVAPIAELGGGDNGNDCWGWTDPDSGREIAIYGRSNGTAFIDVTNPTDMNYFANIPTSTSPSLWRDIKVYNNHAFIVSEAGGHGIQIINLDALMELPLNEVTQLDPDGFYGGFGNAHNIMINEETGYAYAIGTSTFSGGLHILDLTNPQEPNLVGSYDGAYSHDVHPIVYQGPDEDYFGREIVICFNGYSGLAIVDAEDKSDVSLVSQLTYQQSGYTHQGYVGENHRYCYFNDELDEQNFGNNTRTYIMDMADLENPFIVGFFEADVESIDHNMYIIGDKMYQSNYLSGLRILDLNDAPTGELELVGYFDTNPSSDAPVFDGTWSNYPYFPSGNVAVSSMTHFFMVQPSNAIAPSTTTAVSDADERPAFHVFPNPASDVIRIDGWKGDLAAYDMAGKCCKRWINLPGALGLHLNINELPSGLYVLQDETGASVRFAVQR
jgi:choice-of-anchor B domain-containing protein